MVAPIRASASSACTSLECVLARPAEPQAGERHAHLGHGEQASRVGEQVERGLGACLPRFRHLAEPRGPNGNQGHFGAREQTVDRDEEHHQQDAQWGIGHVIRNNSIGDS